MALARPGLSPVMVGRAGELAELGRLVGLLGDPDQAPQVAVVSGEAGVGKSRLVRELAARVPSGTLVLSGHADEGDLGQPFALLRDAVEPIVAAWRDVPAALVDRDHALRHLLAPLLPHDDHVDDHQHAGEELVRAALDLLRYLIGAGPAVLVFEDLHWADAESIALFGRLAELAGLPLLVVGTFRPEDFDRRHPLGELLGGLERQRTVTHVSLARLSRLELAEMLEAVYEQPVSSRVSDALHRRTQGNPFFVEELVATADASQPEELAAAPLPWNAAEAVLRRVDDLDADARKVVDAASVLGARIDFDVLAAVSGVDEDALIDALRVLVDRGLLVEGEPDVFAFRHALTREAVVGQLLGRQRRRLHRAAYDALVAAGSDDHGALAAHAAGAGRWDELVEHARHGATRFLNEGSGVQALRLAELGLAEATDDIVLRSLASRAAWTAGMIAAAERHAEQWHELAVEDGDAEQEALALRQRALLRWEADDPAGAWAHADAAVAVMERLGSTPGAAWVVALRSQMHMLQGDRGEAVEWADRAIAMAEELGLGAVRASALVNKGTALADTPGREEEGIALLAQAREEAAASGDVVSIARSLNNAIWHHIERADARDAWPLLAESRAVAERYGLDVFAAKVAMQAAQLAAMDARMADVVDEIARGRRAAASGGQRVMLDLFAAEVAVEQGDVDAAEDLLVRVRSSTGRIEDGMVRQWVLVDEAACAAARGDAARAEAALEPFLEPIRSDPGCRRDSERAATLTLHGLRAGVAPARMRAFLGEHGTLACDRHEGSWLLDAEAAILEAEGAFEEAAARYREALEVRTPVRPQPAVASTLVGLARCLGSLGQTDEARRNAQRAVDLLEHWPGWRRREAESLVRRLGGSGRDGDSLLTPREQEVLQLLTEGLTNRQIAERLYISTKTAAVHVSNILGKTGLSSRTEAATWAVRSGAVPQ